MKLDLFNCVYENDSDRWYFSKAPEPSDIFWEHLKYGYCNRVIKGIFSYLSTTILMLLCFGIIYLAKDKQI